MQKCNVVKLDIDVSDRPTVINYLIDKYGENRVCQIINFSYITPVVAIKDVGKILGFKYDERDKLSKKFSYNTFQECIDNNISYLSEHPEYSELLDIAGKLSGRVKTVSCHAGGVGIVDTDISDYMAMKLGSDGEHVIQVDKRLVEQIGIIKFDILGVQTLKMVQEIQNDLHLSEYDININNPKFENDRSPFELLNKALTNGVFQVESAGMKDLLLRLQATNMEDLSAVLALYRPDSMGALEEFIKCKHDPSLVTYIHPDMKPILESTYGQCVAENELISTPNGNVRIQDIKENDLVYTIHGINRVKKFWCNGLKNIFEVTLNSNRKIKCTDNHRLLTSSGWKEVKDLLPTDVIAVRVGNNNTQEYNIDKLKMIGYLIGDGCFRENNFIHFYNTNIDIVCDFKRAVERAYPDSYVLVKGKDVPSGSYVYDCEIRSRTYYDKKYDLLNDVKRWNLQNKLSIEKEFPSFIFGLSSHCILTVLGAYLDTDGSYTQRGHIRFKTGSSKLAYGLQELIRLVGFSSHIYSHGEKEHDICVHNSCKFYDILCPYSYKLTNAIKNNMSDKDMTNVIPLGDIAPFIKQYLNTNNISARQAYKKTGSYIFKTYNSERAKKYNCMQVTTLRPLMNICNFPREWFDENLVWERIKEIKDLQKTSLVYDIEVEDEHNFVVNGVIAHNCIYQEQIMEIVRVFGGRSYGGSDKYRKAIGKKMPELVKEESKKLYQEIIDNGYDENIAKAISEELAAKGGYCFNKSHSYSYAVLCFQTAYLKINYPVYFFKALFNLNKDKAGMVNKYIVDSKQFGVSVLPPHINKSLVDFSIYDNNVLFGFSAITGIGERIAQEIVAEREKNGKYKKLPDLLSRTTLTKTQIISLIKSGAIPTKDKKSCLLKYLKSLYKPLEYKELSKLPTYNKLIVEYDIDIEKYRIGNGKYDYDKDLLLTLVNQKKKEKFDLQQEDRLKQFLLTNNKYLENADFWEFEALQIFIHNNPFEEALPYLTTAFEAVENDNDCVIVGVISRVQKKKDRNKKPFAFVNIYSTFGIIEGVLWNSQLVQYEDLAKKGSQVAIKCRKTDEDKVTIQAMRPYAEWLSERKKRHGRKNL